MYNQYIKVYLIIRFLGKHLKAVQYLAPKSAIEVRQKFFEKKIVKLLRFERPVDAVAAKISYLNPV